MLYAAWPGLGFAAFAGIFMTFYFMYVVLCVCCMFCVFYVLFLCYVKLTNYAMNKKWITSCGAAEVLL